MRTRRVIHKPKAMWLGETGARFRAAVKSFVDDESEEAGVRLLARRHLVEIDGQRPSKVRWEFGMIETDLNAEVVRFLVTTSVRPAKAVHLWSICLREMDYEGEIGFNRTQLADELGVSPKVVSTLMSELCRCEALMRRPEDDAGHRGRTVRWSVNPRLATRKKRAARDEAQKSAPLLKFPAFTVIDGGNRRGERRSYAARVALPVL